MQKWVRRIRAGIVMGIIWAVAWAMAGGVLARLPGFDTDLPLPLLFAPLGFITGVIFSVILVGVERRRESARPSIVRFTGWGAASGVLLAAVIVGAAALRGDDWWSELLLFGPPLTIASAACAAGSLALARRGERGELTASHGRQLKASRRDAEGTEN